MLAGNLNSIQKLEDESKETLDKRQYGKELVQKEFTRGFLKRNSERGTLRQLDD